MTHDEEDIFMLQIQNALVSLDLAEEFFAATSTGVRELAALRVMPEHRSPPKR